VIADEAIWRYDVLSADGAWVAHVGLDKKVAE